MLCRLAASVCIALGLAAPALLAQQTPAVVPAKKPAVSTKPWPEDDELAARADEARNRRLFQDDSVLEFTLTSDFKQINRQRTPNNGLRYDGILTVGGNDIPVKVGSRGHLRLDSKTCDFVPIRIEFGSGLAGTVFEGQTNVKLGTHCRNEIEFDQFVMREYLAYRLTNLVTPQSFRARLARATYVDIRSRKKISTHLALFLEHENDVARRLGGRQVTQRQMVFSDFDSPALTTMMLLEYMLGNIDYSIWGLHNVVIVQNKSRRFLPVPYDFDLSGMVHPPYAAPDPRLPMRTATDRLYRGPCRTVEEFNAAAEPFRARKGDMLAAIDSMRELTNAHKSEMKDYLDAFFRRIATPDAIKKTFVDGCPATRRRV